MISMMKLGETKAPIERIPALAEARGADAQDFLRIAMLEYRPEMWGVLNVVFDPKLSDWPDPKRCVSRENLKELKIRQKFG